MSQGLPRHLHKWIAPQQMEYRHHYFNVEPGADSQPCWSLKYPCVRIATLQGTWPNEEGHTPRVTQIMTDLLQAYRSTLFHTTLEATLAAMGGPLTEM